MRRTVHLDLTPAQAQLVNSTLALYEAEGPDADPDYNNPLVQRTRGKVWAALEAAGVDL